MRAVLLGRLGVWTLLLPYRLSWCRRLVRLVGAGVDL